MISKINSIEYLVGSSDYDLKADVPFSNEVCNFLGDLSLKLNSYDSANVKYEANSYDQLCSKNDFLNTYKNIINEFLFIRRKWE